MMLGCHWEHPLHRTQSWWQPDTGGTESAACVADCAFQVGSPSLVGKGKTYKKRGRDWERERLPRNAAAHSGNSSEHVPYTNKILPLQIYVSLIRLTTKQCSAHDFSANLLECQPLVTGEWVFSSKALWWSSWPEAWITRNGNLLGMMLPEIYSLTNILLGKDITKKFISMPLVSEHQQKHPFKTVFKTLMCKKLQFVLTAPTPRECQKFASN